jgi:hypothetical protein
MHIFKILPSQTMVAYACNPSYLGGSDWEDHGLRQIVSETPISRTTRAKWTRGVAQVLQHVLCEM